MGAWMGYGVLVGVLALATAADCRTGKIPNRLTVPAMLAGIVIWTCSGGINDGLRGSVGGMGHCLLALACGLLPSAVLVAVGGMGGGDAKLIGVVGALSGDWRFVVATTFYGFIVAAAIAVFLVVRHRIVIRTATRLGMALCAILGRRRPVLADDSPRVPMAAALLVGALVAGLERFGALPWPWTS